MLLLFLVEQTVLNLNPLDANLSPLGKFVYKQNSKWPPSLLNIVYNFVKNYIEA